MQYTCVFEYIYVIIVQNKDKKDALEEIMTVAQLAKEIGISKSSLYNHLKDTLNLEQSEDNGRYIYNDVTIATIKEQLSFLSKIKAGHTPKIKTLSIQNRRYLGNKYKLLPFIDKIVKQECKNINTVADIFAGTGVVCSLFKDKKLILNDILYSNYITYDTWFGSENVNKVKLLNLINNYNNIQVEEDNYMSDNFSNTFFCESDCKKIGYIRENINTLYNDGYINKREKSFLITALLYAMDRVANTCGHYDAYIRNSKFEKKLELFMLDVDNNNNPNNVFYKQDANELVKNIEADLVYIDPPYNSRQYCDAYHLLENVALWNKPAVAGIARKMDRSKLKSDYCTNSATKSFDELIGNINAKYILLSYNNMANKGNDRSNSKISDEDIIRILKKKGEVKVFSEKYKAFTTGKSSINDNEERLFLCICHQEDNKKSHLQSPLNYTGGKFKLLEQILPLFPKNIDTFIDLFCGGCNVGINVDCKKVIFNDNNQYLISMLNTFKNLDKSILLTMIDDIITSYNLSRSDLYGYEKYCCTSSKGLGNFNCEGYLKLREDFNYKFQEDYHYYVALYVLICYTFNNQIRFNSKGKFNLPVGKRDFNSKMRNKFNSFIDKIKNSDYSFLCKDFNDINIEDYGENSFVYADPPYLIACATYNEQNAWNENNEKSLLDLLDKLDKKGIKFALSNILQSKGKENKILKEWLEINKDKYYTIHLNNSYSNCNYQTKNKDCITDEVLIINYKGVNNG